MSVNLRCPKCNASIRVAEERAGKRIRCPKCRWQFAAAAEGGDRAGDLPASEPSSARPASGIGDEKVGEQNPIRAPKSFDAKWIILGAAGGAVCGLIVLAAIVFIRFGLNWSKAPNAAQTAQPAVAAAPSESPPQTEPSSTESAASPQDPDESAAKLGAALQKYLRAHRDFPVSRGRTNGKDEHGFDSQGRPLLSWRVHLLPYLGQKALYGKFNQHELWDSPHNKVLLASMPEVYRTGARDPSKTQWHMLSGKDVLSSGMGPQHVHDGTANTIAFVLAGADHADFWTRPDDLPFNLDEPLASLGKIESVKLHCVMANGKPVALSAKIPAETLAALVTPQGNDVVDIESLLRREELRSGKRFDPADPQIAKLESASLRRLYSALRNYRTVFHQFPVIDRPEYFDDKGRPKLSWRVHLLPFLNQKALYSKFNLEEPWDSETNRPLAANMPDIFRAPEDSPDSQTTRLLMVHSAAKPGAGASEPALKSPPSRRDGRRSAVKDAFRPAILVAQVGPDRAVLWTRPDELEINAEAPLAGLGTLPSSGFSVLMSNGRIYRLKSNLPPELFKSLATGIEVAALEDSLGEYRVKLPDEPVRSVAEKTAREPASPPPASRAPSQPAAEQKAATTATEHPARPPEKRIARDSSLRRGRSASQPPAPAAQNGAARASVPALDMPEDYCDYALDPETGDIVALSAEYGEAVFYRGKDLDARKVEPAAKVRVGAAPCAVFFKRYRDLRVFAVASQKDPHLYLISASDGTLQKKIELSQAGLSHVTGSINPDDPFVYYILGRSALGVVNLRSLRDEGLVLDQTMDCAFSASGTIAYRRGYGAPHGFESRFLTNSFQADKPTFSRLFYEHTSNAEYVPDPFDRYTAVGTKLYSRSLEKVEATLNITPVCFFKTRPVIIGVLQRTFPSPPITGSTLFVVSYNSFCEIGRSVFVPLRNAESPPNTISSGDFRGVSNRTRIFADDARDRVIYASRRQIFFVPLDEFKLPREPFLTATLDSSNRLPIGQESSRTVKLSDPQVSITFDELPEGMQADGKVLKWRPREDQIGPAKVAATLKAGDLERTTTFELSVVYPGATLPFNPTGLAAGPDPKQVLIWTDSLCEQQMAPRPVDLVDHTSRVAKIDLATGRVLAERAFPEPVQRALLTADHALLVTGTLSPRCEIVRASDLKHEKDWILQSPIVRFDLFDKLLVVQTSSGSEIYETSSFKRLRVFSESDAVRGGAGLALQNGPTSEGLIVNGVLYDAELKPRLLLAPWPIRTLPGGDPRWRPRFARQSEPTGNPVAGGIPRVPYSQVASARLPGSDTMITLSMQRHSYQPPRAVMTIRTLIELSIAASGAANSRQILYRDEGLAEGQNCSTHLFVAPGVAFVAFNGILYRWPVKPDLAPAGATPPLRLAAHQSALVLDDKGKTILKHAAQGGKPPYKFTIATPFEGIQINETSGDVTIDAAAMRPEIQRALEQAILRRSSPPDSLLDAFESQTVPATNRAIAILGHKPSGTPAAIPIHVEVQDSDSDSDSLQYYVLAEVPTADLKKRLRQLDEERDKATPPRSADQAPGNEKKKPDAAKPSDEVAELKRRIQALEDRLDLVTRQLNELLKKSNGK